MLEPITPRAVDAAEIGQLARLWCDAWHETHARLAPPDLTRLRTLDSFAMRLRAAHPNIRAVGPPGAAVGFNVTKDDEVYQLFVAPAARGTGAARALLDDAETRLRAAGVQRAWLACAIGNARAARFYEKSGWRLAGTVVDLLETSAGAFPLEVWRYEKPLTGGM